MHRADVLPRHGASTAAPLAAAGSWAIDAQTGDVARTGPSGRRSKESTTAIAAGLEAGLIRNSNLTTGWYAHAKARTVCAIFCRQCRWDVSARPSPICTWANVPAVNSLLAIRCWLFAVGCWRFGAGYSPARFGAQAVAGNPWRLTRVLGSRSSGT